MKTLCACGRWLAVFSLALLFIPTLTIAYLSGKTADITTEWTVWLKARLDSLTDAE